MNIIIPIGGKGERFSKNGYTKPKPLIPIFNKPMIFYVLDNLRLLPGDKVFIIYYNLDQYDFENIIHAKYPAVHFVQLQKQTKGAAETIFLGLNEIIGTTDNRKTMLFDCDTFYTQDVVSMFREVVDSNAVFYVKNTDPNPIFSYITMDNVSGVNNIDGIITDIKEKRKISDYANTGIYCFSDIHILHKYARKVVEEDIKFNNECYTSCIISEMLSNNRFMEIKLDTVYVFNLGTPLQLDKYIENTHTFLFDLDGTLVITEDIYYEIWKDILFKYKIIITPDIFKTIISGNNDTHVFSKLLPNISTSDYNTISSEKDAMFCKHIDKIKIIDGANTFLETIYKNGHKMAIVTNSNRATAELILNYLKIDNYFETIIIGSECSRSKPYPDPYMQGIRWFDTVASKTIILEDSKTGILSAQGVFPKCIIGIQTLYSANELMNIGVDFTLENYLNVSFDTFLNICNINIKMLQECIKFSLNWEILDIHIDDEKLKGGFISDVIALQITTTKGVVPCVLKLESKNETFLSKMSNDLELYQREYYFYENISKFVPIKIPEFYGLIYDRNFKNIGILMQNLTCSQTQFRLNLDLNRESVDVSFKIISSIAKMHSKFWGCDLQKKFIGLKKHNDPAFCPYWNDFISSRWPIFIDKWSHVLTPEHKNIAENIVANFTEIQQKMSSGPLTLCHGDVKSANIFYEVCENGQYEPYFIDWQYTILGKGVQDLVFFMIESFDITTIGKYKAIFKDYYYLKLLENGVSNYSRLEYETDFANAVQYFPFFVAIWFGTVNDDELIDKNFPVFFIQKLFAFLH